MIWSWLREIAPVVATVGLTLVVSVLLVMFLGKVMQRKDGEL